MHFIEAISSAMGVQGVAALLVALVAAVLLLARRNDTQLLLDDEEGALNTQFVLLAAGGAAMAVALIAIIWRNVRQSAENINMSDFSDIGTIDLTDLITQIGSFVTPFFS